MVWKKRWGWVYLSLNWHLRSILQEARWGKYFWIHWFKYQFSLIAGVGWLLLSSICSSTVVCKNSCDSSCCKCVDVVSCLFFKLGNCPFLQFCHFSSILSMGKAFECYGFGGFWLFCSPYSQLPHFLSYFWVCYKPQSIVGLLYSIQFVSMLWIPCLRGNYMLLQLRSLWLWAK